jgi:hypothetical protein
LSCRAESRHLSLFVVRRFDSLTSRSLNLRSPRPCRGFPAAPFSTSLRFGRNNNAIITIEIRFSVLSRSRNRQATALQKFSNLQCVDDETQASTHATFGAENFLQSVAHKFYRRARDGRDDEDAPEPDECVRCAAGIQLGLPDCWSG